MNVIINCSNPDCEKRDQINRGDKLKTCSDCRSVKYCNTKCQKVHWKKTHKNMCGDLRKRHIEGFKSNTTKMMKKAGKQIPPRILRKAYRYINDDENSVQALCWDQKLDKTHILEKKMSPPRLVEING